MCVSANAYHKKKKCFFIIICAIQYYEQPFTVNDINL